MPLKSARRNKATAFKHAKVIDDYLCNKTKLGRVAGPFTTPAICQLHISSFGIIPEKGQLGKWHLRVDMSSPGGRNVNVGIDPAKFSMQYVQVDGIIQG